MISENQSVEGAHFALRGSLLGRSTEAIAAVLLAKDVRFGILADHLGRKWLILDEADLKFASLALSDPADGATSREYFFADHGWQSGLGFEKLAKSRGRRSLVASVASTVLLAAVALFLHFGQPKIHVAAPIDKGPHVSVKPVQVLCQSSSEIGAYIANLEITNLGEQQRFAPLADTEFSTLLQVVDLGGEASAVITSSCHTQKQSLQNSFSLLLTKTASGWKVDRQSLIPKDESLG